MNAGAETSRARTGATARAATWTVVTIVTLCGACLRVAAARGDLWLDEIWTFRLLETVHGPREIILGLPNDNNHVLTTLWLWLVGAHASPLMVRLPAIVFGTSCAPVAARIFARHGAAAAIAAATVFAGDYAFVHFGSEARGYSGLILAALVAFGAVEAMLADGITRRRQLVLALAIAFGTFSHLTMIEITAVLCAWVATTLAIRHGWRGMPRGLVAIAVPTLVGSLPPLLCLAISLTAAPLHTGFLTPFTVSALTTGLSRMAGATLGLPDIDPGQGWIRMALVAGAVLLAVALVVVPPRRRVFYAFALFGVPTLHVALRLPNQQYPRFHLIVAIALALLLVDVWNAAWRRTPRVAIAIAGVFLLAQAVNLRHFIGTGRGHFAEAVAAMLARGPATFAAEPAIQAGETRAVVRWYAGPALTPITQVTCTTLPDWLVVVTLPDARPDVETQQTIVLPACPILYDRAARYPAYGLSGFAWTLYRRP